MPAKPKSPQESFLPGVVKPLPWMGMARTAEGHPVVYIHYYADEDHTHEWAIKQAAKTTTQAWWDQEMEMKADAMSGQLVFPEFDSNVHMIPDEKVPKRLCRYMAIDPHPRTPHAFLWVGIDQWDDWYVYRELWPSIVSGTPNTVRDDMDDNKFTVKEYAETIAWLEGNRIEWRNAETEDEEGIYRREHTGERIIDRFMDQAGKGFYANAEHQREETYTDRYYRFGIECLDPIKSHHAGEDAVNNLLKVRSHDVYGKWPRLHIAQSCSELEIEFKKLRYKRSRNTEEKELKQEGVEARRHLLDLLRYLATARLSWSASLAS